MLETSPEHRDVAAGARLATTRPQRRRTAPAWVPVLAAGLLYVAGAIWATWPLAIDLDGTIYGPEGDMTGSIAYFRELVEHRLNPYAPGRIPDWAAPEGQPVRWTLNVVTAPITAFMYAATALVGGVAAMGLFTLLGYVVTGVATFLLVRRLTGHVVIAAISGWAFAFSPIFLVKGQGHGHFIHGWVLVLLVWRMLALMETPSRRNVLLAAAALVLTFFWTPYFILFGGVAFVTLALAGVVWGAREHRLVRQLLANATVGAAGLVTLGAMALLDSRAAASEVPTNTLEAIYVYAARPLEYVVPPYYHPLLGERTAPYFATHQHGSNLTETTLYVGVTVVSLAFVAVAAALLRRLEPTLRRTSLVLASLVLVALLCSAPPTAILLGVEVPFPSRLLFELTPAFRGYSRFAIVAMLGLAVLAGIGLHVLVRSRRPRVAGAVLVLAAVLVPLDLGGRLAGRTAKLRAPAIYDVLARQPPGILAEYPIKLALPLYSELLWQQRHGKPVLGGYLPGTAAERRALNLANLSDPLTPTRLANLGVRYVLLTTQPPAPDAPGPGTPGPGLAFIARGDYGALYRVTRQPGAPLSEVATGFPQAERDAQGAFHWLQHRRGTIALTGACSPCAGRLRFRTVSFAVPRTLLVRMGKRVLARRRVPVEAPVVVDVPVRFDRRATVEVAVTPGPRRAADYGLVDDPRSLSILVRDLTFTSRARLPAS